MKEGDDYKEIELDYDSVMRSEKVIPLQLLTLRPFDQIKIEVKTATPDEYNPYLLIDRSNANNLQNIGGPLGTIVGFNIDENGNIELPLIGDVKLSELTINEAERLLQGKLKDLMDEPTVYIKLLNFRFTVLGEVKSPAIYGTLNREISILEGIAQAGGVDELGDRSRIKLIRKNNDIAEVVYIDLNSESFIASPYYYLQQEDVIIVMPLRQRPFLKYFSQNLALVTSITGLVISIVTLVTTSR
ncbi:polysaccharide biosynthesis/export family protein [Flammeovirga pacifica]|uniref:polysaccharide biosynthesis/export family protein n=1 Tax=Flammeovirga pacifica TaxID=915059 RepID=UPI001114862D|nr:polysaccharide biosynthesis/export family protein [Flammeovirga pacifica]